MKGQRDGLKASISSPVLDQQSTESPRFDSAINPSDVPLPLGPEDEAALLEEAQTDAVAGGDFAIQARSAEGSLPGMPLESTYPIALDTNRRDSCRSDNTHLPSLDDVEPQDNGEFSRSDEAARYSPVPLTRDDAGPATLTSSPEPMDIEPENESPGEFDTILQQGQLPPSLASGERGFVVPLSVDTSDAGGDQHLDIDSAHISAKTATEDVDKGVPTSSPPDDANERESRPAARGAIELTAAVAAGLQDAGFDPALALQNAPFTEPSSVRRLEEPDFDDFPQHSSMKSSRRGSRRQSRAQSLDRSRGLDSDSDEDIGQAITSDGPKFESLLAASLERAGFDANVMAKSDGEREIDETDMIEISAMRQRSSPGWTKSSARTRADHSPTGHQDALEASDHGHNSFRGDDSATALDTRTSQEHDKQNYGLGVTHIGRETLPQSQLTVHQDGNEDLDQPLVQRLPSTSVMPPVEEAIQEASTRATQSPSTRQFSIQDATKQTWSFPENRDSAIAVDYSPVLPDLEPSLSRDRDRDSGFQDNPRTPDFKGDSTYGRNPKSKRSPRSSPKSPIQVQVDVVDDCDVTVSQGSPQSPAANPRFETRQSFGRSLTPPAVESTSKDRATSLPLQSARDTLGTAATLQSPGHGLSPADDGETVETDREFISTKNTHPLTEIDPDEREAKVPRISRRSRSPGRRYATFGQTQDDQFRTGSPSSKSSTEELLKRRPWPSIPEEGGTEMDKSGLDSQTERRLRHTPTRQLRHVSSRDGLRSPASSSRSLGSSKGERMEHIGGVVSPSVLSRDGFPSRDPNPNPAELLATAATVGAIVGASSLIAKTRSPGTEGLYVSFAPTFLSPADRHSGRCRRLACVPNVSPPA